MDDLNKTVGDKIKNIISKEKLIKYLDLTGTALKMCSESIDLSRGKEAKDFLDMAQRYHSDAGYFMKNDDYVLAFAAINYAHGWLDAGARIGLFKVNDSNIFTVDD